MTFAMRMSVGEAVFDRANSFPHGIRMAEVMRKAVGATFAQGFFHAESCRRASLGVVLQLSALQSYRRKAVRLRKVIFPADGKTAIRMTTAVRKADGDFYERTNSFPHGGKLFGCGRICANRSDCSKTTNCPCELLFYCPCARSRKSPRWPNSNSHGGKLSDR